MDFLPSPRAAEWQPRLQRFLDDLVVPSLPDWHRWADAGAYPLDVLQPLQAQARAQGLWNLYLPTLREDQPGTRLDNLDYAPLAEAMGWVPWSPEVFNCQAPDSGNVELLQRFATPDQARQWLDPLLAGEIRSAFAMSEPDTASSDPTQLATQLRPEGDHWRLSGRKWFITGLAHPLCRLVVVMAAHADAPEDAPHGRHSLVLLPLDTPGLTVERNIPVMDHLALEGHCELRLRDVRVEASQFLGTPGSGFGLAQARLGPGRVHHAMRAIGQCELALALMVERARERRAFGQRLADFANVQEMIARSRIEIDQARLLVLHAAWRLDREGAGVARDAVASIKWVSARLLTEVGDRAMQVFGAMGLSPDTPLARMWAWGRAMRFLDGPDEVHLRSVARRELRHGAAPRRDLSPWLRRWTPPPG